MRSRGFILGFIAVAIVIVFAGWSVYASRGVGADWSTVFSSWPAILVSLLLISAAVVAGVWTAIYSARRGYDEPPEIERKSRGR
jgi:hypothetical protein